MNEETLQSYCEEMWEDGIFDKRAKGENGFNPDNSSQEYRISKKR